jgi:hypothetical protein
MFIFVVQTLLNKWNEICIKQLAGREHFFVVSKNIHESFILFSHVTLFSNRQ